MSLTHRQRQLLNYLDQVLENGCGKPPPYKVIAHELGLVSKSNVYRFMSGLEERGYIARQKKRGVVMILKTACGEPKRVPDAPAPRKPSEWSQSIDRLNAIISSTRHLIDDAEPFTLHGEQTKDIKALRKLRPVA